MKLILSILLSLLSLNLFAADGALGTASGTTTVGTIPAGNLPALGVAYPNALTNNSTVAWTNTDNITALTFSGAGSGQGILQLSNAAATGLTVILGPSNAFANTILASNTFNIYNGATLEANIDNSGNQTNAGTFQVPTAILTTRAQVKQTDYTTNQNQIVPDFALGYQLITTNAAFTFLAPAGVDTTKTLAQTTVVLVTNTTAAAVAVTAPANVHTQGTWYVTNVTSFTFFQYAQKFTNATALPLW